MKLSSLSNAVQLGNSKQFLDGKNDLTCSNNANRHLEFDLFDPWFFNIVRI